MAAGDLKNSVSRLRALLKATRYPHAQAHANGEFAVADLLRILHHALLDYSRHVAAFVLEKGYDLYGKTDARFIDHCFRLMRDEFQYFPSVNPTQFLSNQFLERKIQLVGDILDVVVKKHEQCVRLRRQEQAVWTKPRELKSSSTHVENHVIPPQPPTAARTVDTWDLLEHFRQEAKQKAREQKRAAAQRIESKRHAHRSNALNSEASTRTRDRSPRPSNQRADASDATNSNSDGEAEKYAPRNPQGSDNTVSSQQTAQARCNCDCGETKDEVHEIVTTLSQQLSELTAAVLSRVSAIESRLGRVEQQLQDLQVSRLSAPSQPTRDPSPGQRYASISRTKAAFSAASSGPSSDAASEMRPRSAWPPGPELFDLA